MYRGTQDFHLPSIDRIGPHIHTSNHDSSQTVLFIPQDIICPGKEGGLTSVYAPSPVVSPKMDTGIVWVRKDHGASDNTSDADPISN